MSIKLILLWVFALFGFYQSILIIINFDSEPEVIWDGTGTYHADEQIYFDQMAKELLREKNELKPQLITDDQSLAQIVNKSENLKQSSVSRTYKELIRDINIQAEIIQTVTVKIMSISNLVGMLRKPNETFSETEKRLQSKFSSEIIKIRPYFNKYCHLIKKIDTSEFKEHKLFAIEETRKLKKLIDAQCTLLGSDEILYSENKFGRINDAIGDSLQKMSYFNGYTSPYISDLQRIGVDYVLGHNKKIEKLQNIYIERWKKKENK